MTLGERYSDCPCFADEETEASRRSETGRSHSHVWQGWFVHSGPWALGAALSALCLWLTSLSRCCNVGVQISSHVFLNLFTPVIAQILREQNRVARTLISVHCLSSTNGLCYSPVPLGSSTALVAKVSGVFSIVHAPVVPGR